ncbi:MAG: adenosylcobyric acid synthase [Gammaproteobacteria bacterium]|jgi:adenosylcobyric acid synthase
MSRFKAAQTLMVQGTTSDAGKSILVTALCRILARNQHHVVPFKPQNMALNSAVTADGGEIGRAQAVQAEACFLQPSVNMNPILLKPNSDQGSQVIVNGKAIGNMDAVAYHAFKPELMHEVIAAHTRLQDEFEFVLVEGAGSPAEINLREHDIANMGFAEAVDCPVIIVADIDRGGVFAHLYGTWALLSASEQQRIKGFVINRFRGDVALLEPGLEWLQEKTSIPVLAVIPYIKDLHIEAEDSISQSQTLQRGEQLQALKVVVPMYPRASNHTDFDVMRMHPQVDCALLRDVGQFDAADLIVLPGSKHVRADLDWLKDNGWDRIIERHLRYGGKVIGICGGYQMLGQWVHDPDGVESAAGSSAGLGLLDQQTTLNRNKTLRNVQGRMTNGGLVSGYEIHAGITSGDESGGAVFSLVCNEDSSDRFEDGVINADNNVLGTYLHGLFDQPDMLRHWLQWAGIQRFENFDYAQFRHSQIERLADEVEQCLPLAKLLELLSSDDAK